VCVATAALTDAAGIAFSRTINADQHLPLHLTFSQGCTSSDAYGSNNCNWAYGSELGIDYNVKLDEDVNSGKLAVNAKVDSILPFVVSCGLCGVNCSLTIPVINIPVDFAMPPCPIKAASFVNSTTVAIPATNPIGAKTTATGTAVITDQNGQSIISLTFSATLA
jgi:hypothetical protein